MNWLFDTLFVTGALIALVLTLRRPVARLFGPGMAYALWALPLLRLVLPPLLLPAQARAEPGTLIVASEVAPIAATTAADPGWTVPWTAVTAIWLLGVALYLAWRVAGYVDMRRRLLAGAKPVGEAGAVRLVETPATAAPVAFGVRDKVVALPPGFMAREDRVARDLAIAHELEHHAGRDLAVNLAVQPLLALHWFNPLAWAGWRALRRDQEAACDARVLAGRDIAARERYAHLIAGYAHGPRLALAAPMACPILGEKSIVHRLRSLTMTEPTRRRRLTGKMLLAAAALALPATASIVYAAQEDAPTPPAPVAPPVPAAAPHAETRVMIVEHNRDGKHEPRFTRTITRDGKTIVIRTDHELSDADIEAKLAKLGDLDDIAPLPPVPPVPPALGAAPAPPVPPRVVTIRRIGQPPGEHTMTISCGTSPEDIDETESRDGQTRVVRMKFCSKGEHMKMALDAMRQARDEIARNTDMSAEMRDRVVKRLDAQIAKLSKTG